MKKKAVIVVVKGSKGVKQEAIVLEGAVIEGSKGVMKAVVVVGRGSKGKKQKAMVAVVEGSKGEVVLLRYDGRSVNAGAVEVLQ